LYIKQNVDFGEQAQAFWKVYTPLVGESYDPCSDSVGEFDAPTDLADGASDPDTALPDGEFDFDFNVGGISGCYYSGPDGTLGTLTCPGHGILPCDYDEAYNNVDSCAFDDEEVEVAKIICSWANEGVVPGA
jgi:hypothetical protein